MAFGRRKKKAAAIEDEIPEEEGPIEGAEFVPDASLKARSDVYTLLLVLSFLVFLAGCIVVGVELHENYDVQYWGVFEVKGSGGGDPVQ